MTGVLRTLASGYLVILHRLLRVGFFLAALALVSGAIALPIWLLASRVPVAFNTIFLFAILGGILSMMVRIHRGRPTTNDTRIAPGSRAFGALHRGLLVGLVIVILAGVSLRSPPLWIGGLLALSLKIAWAQGNSR